MRNILFLLFTALLASACTEQKKQAVVVVKEKQLSKLEQLMQLPRDSVMDYYDLSNDSIRDFPDLSGYTIKSLDLSHNLLDTVIVDYLPKGLMKIDMSYNVLNGIFTFVYDNQYVLSFKERDKYYRSSTIREINLSHNKLTGIDIGFHLRKIIVSYNDITYINFNHKNIEYFDISYNPHLSNKVGFQPDQVDTIIRDGIANDKKLVPKNQFVPHYDYLIISDSLKK